MRGCDKMWGMSEHEPGYGSVVELGDKPTEAVTDIFTDQLKRLLRLRKDHEDKLSFQGIRMLDNDIVTRIGDLRKLGHGDRITQVINPPKEPPKT